MAEPEIADATNLFIRRWGEMAASWGVSRTMAEIHALLFLATQPLCTDEVMASLAVSRGSASMNLRELVNWGLIERVHQRGDRKEYFVAETDAWTMFETITRERRRREVQPIVETIERCLAMIDRDRGATRGEGAESARACRERLADILDLFELMNSLSNIVLSAGQTRLRPLLKRLTKMIA